MKIIFMIFFTCFGSLSNAMTKDEFLKLDDSAKAEFINTQAVEVDEEKEIQSFQENNREFMNLILKTADSVSNIWGDTILEGSYALTGDTETNVYTLYTSNNEVYAVFATVSAPAIITDSCDYNEETDEWGDDCSEGNISESFVVDVEGNVIDMGYYAEFD